MNRCLFATYIVRCSDESLYVGQTADLVRRMATYAAGEGGGYVVRRLPVALVHVEWFASRPEALAREAQLKGWTRAKKEALIRRDEERLLQLVHGEWRAEGIERPAHKLVMRMAPGDATPPAEKSLE